ncbi:MAG: hypothetical protein FWH11_12235 [Micrococcales bacterium]|nr:hypothetical protein [Micrococcales bacterium]
MTQTQLHDYGTLWVVQDADDQTAPDVAAVVAELAVQVAEIAQRLGALVSDTATIRADVESVGHALVEVCGLRSAA